MPGPPPIPTALKVLRGNPGHEKIRSEVKPTRPFSLPPPPPSLAGYAEEEWGRIGAEAHRLGLLTNVDIHALAAYCDAYQRWRQAREELEHEPLVYKTKLGRSPNPLIKVVREAAHDMVKFGGEFGFTPVARARLGSAVDNPEPRKFAGLFATG